MKRASEHAEHELTLTRKLLTVDEPAPGLQTLPLELMAHVCRWLSICDVDALRSVTESLNEQMSAILRGDAGCEVLASVMSHGPTIPPVVWLSAERVASFVERHGDSVCAALGMLETSRMHAVVSLLPSYVLHIVWSNVGLMRDSFEEMENATESLLRQIVRAPQFAFLHPLERTLSAHDNTDYKVKADWCFHPARVQFFADLVRYAPSTLTSCLGVCGQNVNCWLSEAACQLTDPGGRKVWMRALRALLCVPEQSQQMTRSITINLFVLFYFQHRDDFDELWIGIVEHAARKQAHAPHWHWITQLDVLMITVHDLGRITATLWKEYQHSVVETRADWHRCVKRLQRIINTPIAL